MYIYTYICIDMNHIIFVHFVYICMLFIYVLCVYVIYSRTLARVATVTC